MVRESLKIRREDNIVLDAKTKYYKLYSILTKDMPTHTFDLYICMLLLGWLISEWRSCSVIGRLFASVIANIPNHPTLKIYKRIWIFDWK